MKLDDLKIDMDYII